MADPARGDAGQRRVPAGPAAGPARLRHRQQPPPTPGGRGPVPVGADGRTVRFTDGSTLDVGIVIWPTGYRSDYSWIHIPGVTRDGQVIHRRGVTDVPGLYFLGLPWQHRRGSALLGFVQEDAAHLAGRVTSRAPARQPAARPASQQPG